MNTDTKRHIDAARQVLVGVVPNPTAQIDQITNALIYKFMDDMDQAAIKQGDEPSFFVGSLEPYAWTRLMDPRIGNQERMNLYGEALIKFSEAKQLPELFCGIFKSAFLPYRSPDVLGLFLKEIAYFDYSHPEELGNAYEYLLSIMSSQGDAGQFRTPRHIIDFIVDVVNPTKDDKVLDPACGTGGFLVSSYKHILAQHDGKDDPNKKDLSAEASAKAEKPLTPDERKKLMTNFEGYDIDPTMARIAQVNMYLHQFKNPKIFQYDTLSSDERWGDKFDVILANPPFMSPKGGIKPHSKFSIQSSRSEVLFVDYIMNHLRPKGRAGIIVPEGIIFQSGRAHRELRKNLVEDGLYAVVSLPSGVFAPYSGVKTSILLFDNELAKVRQEIVFVKVEQDGYDLGATKRPINKNDLPMALQILDKWRKGEKVENKLVVYVEKSKIAENGDYNLTGDRYRVATDYSGAKWPMVELGEVCTFEYGKPMKEENRKNGEYPVFGSNGIVGYHNEFLVKGPFIVVGRKGTAGAITWSDKDGFPIDTTFYVQLKNDKQIDLRFLFYIMTTLELGKINIQAGVPGLNRNDAYKVKIPLPPMEIQEQVVAEIDGYQKVIDGIEKAASAWKPRIEVDPKWEKVKLGEVCEVIGGGTPSRTEAKYWGGKIPWISARYFSDEHTIKGSEMITEEGLKNSSSKIAPKGSTILITRVSVGKFAIADQDYAINQDLTALVSKNKKLLDEQYLWLISEIVAERIKTNAVGVGVTGVTRDFIINQEIPLPPLAVQKQIVEKIEFERGKIEGAKELVPIYRERIKSTIAKLWVE